MRKIKLIKKKITMLTIGVLLMGNVCKAAETGGYVETVKTGESTLFGPLYKARAKGYSVMSGYHYTRTQVYLWITQESLSSPKAWGKGKVWSATNYSKFTCIYDDAFECRVDYGYGSTNTK